MFGGDQNTQKLNVAVEDSSTARSVLDIVSQDLNLYLNQSGDRQKRLNFLSRKLGIHKKTLQRISLKENRPSYSTIIKFYRFLYNTDSDSKVLELVAEPVKTFLKKSFPVNSVDDSGYNDANVKILTENPVALEIYLLAAVKGIETSEVILKFGKHGQKIVNDLVQEKLLSEKNPNCFTMGLRNIIFTPEMIISAGKIVLSGFAKPQSGYEMGKHHAGFYGEKLNEKAYKEWIAIDQKAMQDKILIAQKKESSGDIPVFCFSIVETFYTSEAE